MRIILLGAPGSGKGTQAEKITAKHNIAHISTGDLLRAEVSAGTELGVKAKAIMDAGQLVSDDIMLGMVRSRLQADDCEKGFMLDGFPRTEVQAVGLDAMLAELGQPIDTVLFFEVPFDEITNRLLGRGRADDNEETIRSRLAVYEAQTKPLVAYYESKSLLKNVDGLGEMDEIATRIEAALA
jgi:adenylate kinase